MNILLYLFTLIYGLIKGIINIYYFFFIKARKYILDKYYNSFNSNNLFSLLFKIVFLSIYEFLVFHIYVFLYLIHDSSLNIKFFGILLRFIIIFSISCILSLITKEIEHIFNYLLILIVSLIHVLVWIIALCFLSLTFDKKLLDIILFKKNIDGLLSILYIFGEIFMNFFIHIFRLIIIIAHFSNILSIIRFIEIYKNNMNRIPTNLLVNSFLYIFLDIFILTPGYIFIMILPPVFIKTNIRIYKKIYNDDGYYYVGDRYLNKEETEDSKIYYPKYTIFKNQILYNTQKAFIYTIAIILTIISIPFLWRIHISISILIDLFKTYEINNFFIKYYNNMIDCLLPIIVFIPFIIDHLSLIHLKALWDCYYNNKDKKYCRRYSLVILRIFYEKWLDIFVFIISIVRIITINFYIYLLRKKFKVEYLFLLLNNESIVKDNSNRNNRYKMLKIIFFDILISSMIILELSLGILNPFLSLKIIKDILLYYIKSKNNTEVKFDDIEIEFIIKSFKNIVLLLFFYIIYFPISLMLNILAFWTIKYNISLLISNNKKAFNKIINKNEYILENTDNKNNDKNHSCFCHKYFDNLILIFKSFINGYILIFEFSFIHITIFRTFFFWNKFIKRDKDTSLEKLIKEQFKFTIMEFIYVPFLLLIIILEPWNFELMIEFFEGKDCGAKADKFKKLIVIFVNDIFIIFIFILLLITITDTIPTILLVIRCIKKKFYPSEENKLIFNLNYKTDDFKTELKTIYNKHARKFTTTFLFILNILLVTRIVPLFKNTWPFFVLFFKKCRNNLIKCFNCKKKKSNEDNDKLSKMPFIIISEICSFLNTKEINLLSQTNKTLNKKANINHIWENIFYNRCDKKLKEVLDDYDYTNFSHTKFGTYKETCKNCYFIILAKQGKVIGPIKTFSDIVEEEAIKSVFNIPFILFFPRIIIAYFLYMVNMALYSIYSFLVNLFHFSPIEKENFPMTISKEIIKNNFGLIDIDEAIIFICQILCILYTIFLILNLPLFYLHYYINRALLWVYTFLDYIIINNYLIENKLETLYSSYDYLLLKIIAGLLFEVFQIILILYVFYIKIIIIFIKCLTCNFRKLIGKESLSKKVLKCSFPMLLLESLYGLIYFIIKYIMFILPSLYYIFIDLNLKSNFTPYNIIKGISDSIYKSNFFVFIQIFVGKYCLNIPFFFLNKLTLKHVIIYLADTSDIVFIHILNRIFNEFKWFYQNLFPLKYIIMYISYSFKCINIKSNKKYSKCLSIILNIISLIIGLLPFYLMYPCFEKDTKKIIFFEIPLLFYAIINLLLSGRILNRVENVENELVIENQMN